MLAAKDNIRLPQLKKKQVGSTVITLFQYITFRGNALSWSEEDVVTSVKPTGKTSPVSGSLDVSCGASPCTANPSFNPSPIKVGSRGSVSYVDRLPGGKYEKLFSLYILDCSAPGVAVQSIHAWSTPSSRRRAAAPIPGAEGGSR
jgi:hypothetical protein